jgi:hypothetical protein
MRWSLLLLVYLAAAIGGLVLVDADQDNALEFYGLVAAASVALGAGTGSPLASAAALILVPLGLPFGNTNQFTGGDDLAPVAWMAGVAAIVSVVVILASAGARRLFERHHRASLQGDR